MEDKLLNMLEQLAVKLNTTADHLWSVLANQASIYSITYMIGCFTAVFTGCIILYRSRKSAYQIQSWDDKDWSTKHSLTIAGFVVSGIFLLAGIAFTFKCLQDMAYIFNPEYYAFQELKELLQGVK